MGLFSKIKKAFKKIADIVTPIKVVTKVVTRTVVVVMRAVAEIEGLVYNAAKELTEAINFGPSWIKSLQSKITNVIFDGIMASSRFKLGVGLLALGAISNNSALRTEGRLELLSASLYFMRMSGAIPQWLMMIVMIVLSFFFPFIMLIVVAIMVAVLMLMKWQLPKLADDPDAMIRHLLMLRKYGLVDDETAALLDLYEDRIKRPDLTNETNFGGFEGGIDFTDVKLDGYIDAIRDALKDHDIGHQGDFNPGDTTVPEAVYPITSKTGSFLFPAMITVMLGIIVTRI